MKSVFGSSKTSVTPHITSIFINHYDLNIAYNEFRKMDNGKPGGADNSWHLSSYTCIKVDFLKPWKGVITLDN